jgi:hypothetical protein
VVSSTHVNPKGSLSADGSFGVYYAADQFETLIAETAHHFARDANDPPRREDMRVLLGSISNSFHDVGTLQVNQREAVLDPSSYAASQELARALRETGSNGLLYPRLCHTASHCTAALWRDVVGVSHQERHLQ